MESKENKVSFIEMKVSIIIPIYNVASYIEECVQSVINQTYNNLEVILVDDCSADNSMDLALKIISQSDRSSIFKIEKHNRNRGLSAARNTGIRRAAGEFIYFLDSDDKIIPECIEKMVGVLKSFPCAEMVCAGNSDYDMRNRHFPKNIIDLKRIKDIFLSYSDFPIASWNKLVSRKFILSNNLFFKEGIVHEDLLWNFYIAKYLKNLCILPENTYYYRHNPKGIMSSNLQKQCDSMDIIIRDAAKHIDNKSVFLQLRFVLHAAHLNYVKRYKIEKQFVLIRYLGAIIYLLRVLSR